MQQLVCHLTQASGLDQQVWNTPPQSEENRWRVLKTKSRQEKAVARTLSSMGIFHFLPLVVSERFHGDRKRQVHLPLFAGYVFLRSDLGGVYQIDRSRRISSIIEVYDQETLHQQLLSMHRAIEGGGKFDPYPYLKHGKMAEIKSGPFRGVRGKIDRQQSKTRLILQVDVLQAAMSIEVDGAMLEPA